MEITPQQLIAEAGQLALEVRFKDYIIEDLTARLEEAERKLAEQSAGE